MNFWLWADFMEIHVYAKLRHISRALVVIQSLNSASIHSADLFTDDSFFLSDFRSGCE
jgi:hypothetical protein